MGFNSDKMPPVAINRYHPFNHSYEVAAHPANFMNQPDFAYIRWSAIINSDLVATLVMPNSIAKTSRVSIP